MTKGLDSVSFSVFDDLFGTLKESFGSVIFLSKVAKNQTIHINRTSTKSVKEKYTSTRVLLSKLWSYPIVILSKLRSNKT